MSTVYFDLETGGLDGKRHPIIQIAAIAVDAQYKEVEVYERKVLFLEENCDPIALQKNNFDPKVWREEGVGPKEVAKEFTSFVRRHAALDNISAKGKPYRSCQMAGHNAAVFDRRFLGEWYDRLGLYCPADWRVLDTMQLAIWHYYVNQKPRPLNYKLETLCEAFGVVMEGEAHDALVDVRATVALAQVLSTKRQKG